MADDDTGPLTLAHLEQIKQALAVIARAEIEIDRAKRAGIDVTQQTQQLADSKAKLLQIKNVYFPNM